MQYPTTDRNWYRKFGTFLGWLHAVTWEIQREQEAEHRRLIVTFRYTRLAPSERLQREIDIALGRRYRFSGRAHQENPASRYSEERHMFEHSIGGI